MVGRHGFDRFSDPQAPVVGDQHGLDYAALVAAEPDVVVLERSAARPPPRLMELAERFGWRVESVPVLSLEQVRASIGMVDRVFRGVGDDAPLSAAAREVLEQWDRAFTSAEASPGATLSMLQGDPIGVLGPGSFSAEMVAALGGEPVPSDGSAYQSWTLGDVIEADPACIVVFAPGATDDATDLLGPLARADLRAVRAGRVVVVRDETSLLPSVRLARTGAELRDAFEALPGMVELAGADTSPDSAAVIRGIRVQRLIAAAVVGVCLAVAGMLLQATLRNPLASPYLLGASSGAGLAIVVATYVGWMVSGAIVTHRPPAVAVLAGAFGALGLVYLLSSKRGRVDPQTLILVGVMVAMLCGALTSLVQSLMPDAGLAVYARWVLGSISNELFWRDLGMTGGVGIAGLVIAIVLGGQLDAMSLDEGEARTLGARPGLVRAVAFVVAGSLTAAAVLLAGPVGFVGLVCPHLARLIVGPTHTRLALASAVVGVVLMVAAEWLCQTVRTPSGRLPVGVVTSLAGAPVFLWLLLRARWAS